MKKFIQVAIIASTSLMFIQTSANAQAWKHCFQNVADKYFQCQNRGGGRSCNGGVERGWQFCVNQNKANNTGRFQEQPLSFEEFYSWLKSRYLGGNRSSNGGAGESRY